MEWSPQQQRALDDLGRWIDEPMTSARDQVKTMHGYAGTGKTTMAKHLAAQSDGRVLFAAYTGKAAYVMRTKGCAEATTIHSLIYKPAGESRSDALRDAERRLQLLQQEWGENAPVDRVAIEIEIKAVESLCEKLRVTEKRKPMFTLNLDSALRDAQCLILDECSMVDDIIGTDLESFGVKILALGDPAQLPPVGAGGRYTKREPAHLLTEVHRHAKESGILRFATDVREGRPWAQDYGNDCRILPHGTPKDVLQDVILQADQVLVGKNVTRHTWNSRYRELLRHGGPLPVAGDKIVCLRNNHKQGLLNGSLWRVHEAAGDTNQMIVEMTISSEEDGGNGLSVVSHAHHFMGREDEFKAMSWGRSDAEEFDYGYALTVHKAQGSQWDEVALKDESSVFRADSRRWLYTGITRAAKQLTVIRG